MEFKAIELRRFEECSVVPGPDNDVIVGVALVVRSASLIAVYKRAHHSSFAIAHTGRALDQLLDTLPKQAYLELIVET
jgi:hypothetical protein